MIITLSVINNVNIGRVISLKVRYLVDTLKEITIVYNSFKIQLVITANSLECLNLVLGVLGQWPIMG